MKKMIEEYLGISIHDLHLFELAFTHRSAVNESKKITTHNERLEFLGDAVLELIVTDYLYKTFPDLQEGILTNLRASLVKTETLAEVAKELKFGDLLKISRGEEMFGGREKTSLLANTVEAAIGAMYRDSGLEVAKHWVTKNIIPRLDDIMKSGDFVDSKSQFQHFAQAELKMTPHYKELSSTGPDHDKEFEVGVFVGEKQYGVGRGASKQIAQQSSAKNALESLNRL